MPESRIAPLDLVSFVGGEDGGDGAYMGANCIFVVPDGVVTLREVSCTLNEVIVPDSEPCSG